jgi:hypothetical protein
VSQNAFVGERKVNVLPENRILAFRNITDCFIDLVAAASLLLPNLIQQIRQGF